MKLKINWGTGIFIAIITIVTGVLFLVYIAARQDFYLVEKDYYLKGVNYQQQIEKKQNANTLNDKVELRYAGNTLKLEFPEIFRDKTLTGTIYFYSPVNDKNDLSLPVKLDKELSQLISLDKFSRGRYKIKLDWTVNEKSFYQELEIILK